MKNADFRRPIALIVCGLLVLAVALAYGQTVRHEFVNLDDGRYVFENRHVLAGLNRETVVWAFTQCDVSSQWQPLTLLSLMADVEMSRSRGGTPDLLRLAGWMHGANVVLHAANSVLLFLLLRAMTGAVWRSAVVAAVFAVHPLHVESVAWVTERKDVLSGLFGLLALWAYVWYVKGTRPHPMPPSRRERGGHLPWVRYLAVAGALTLGLMCKPMLVTWPLLFLLLDYWPLQRRLGLGLLLEKLPLLLLVAVCGAVAFLAQRQGGAVIPLDSVSISARIARATVLYAVYVGKTLWPANLAVVYSEGGRLGLSAVIVAATLLGLVTAVACWGAGRGMRWLAVGWLWFLGTLVPAIGLVQVGLTVRSDRFLYLPQIGLVLAVVWSAARLAGTSARRGRWMGALAAMACAALALCAWQQTSCWHDSERLWRHTLACTSGNAVAHYNLGIVLRDRQRLDDAIDELSKSIAIEPNVSRVQFEMGIALVRRGRLEEAGGHFLKALEIDPNHADAHNNIGLLLAHRGRVDEAIAHFRHAVEAQPGNAEAQNNLGVALAARGEFQEAIIHYRAATRLEPRSARAYNNLGAALANLGNAEDSVRAFQTAAELQPDFVDAYLNLGAALAGRGQRDEALRAYRTALAVALRGKQGEIAGELRRRIAELGPRKP